MKTRKKRKKVVKVPSMRRFQEYLRRVGACAASWTWLRKRDFRTVREMYEFLADQCGVLERRKTTVDAGVVCRPVPWLRWLFISPTWRVAGRLPIAPDFGEEEYGNCTLQCVADKDLPPPWEEVREYLRFEVNRLVDIGEPLSHRVTPDTVDSSCM